MPVSTPYSWKQTDEEVLLEVALKNAALTAADIDGATAARWPRRTRLVRLRACPQGLSRC